MFTCSKEYRDIPFAHRQHNHDGHCALIHGHNWGFKFTFAADQLDENGFVFDFGKLKTLKNRLDLFDHALAINQDDPERTYLKRALDGSFARIVTVPSGSAEGLAKLFWKMADDAVQSESGGRVRCVECVCMEDAKNSATYRPDVA